MPWDNPIWTYRIRARWWRRLSPLTRWAIAAALVILGAITSVAAAQWAFSVTRAAQMRWHDLGYPLYPYPRVWIHWLYAAYGALVALWSALAASMAVAGERQRATWDQVVVSRLSAGQIILAKFAGVVWPPLLLGVWMLLIWAALFVGAERGPWPPGPASDWSWGLRTGLRAAGRALPFAALGLYVSFRSRTLATATALTMALVALLLIVSHVGVPRMPYHPYALEMIPVWLLARWPLSAPIGAGGDYPFQFFARCGTLLSVLTDIAWIALLPALLLARLITRFDEFDRIARGDAGGIGPSRLEPLGEGEPSEHLEP